jgi:hypothetical protein
MGPDEKMHVEYWTWVVTNELAAARVIELEAENKRLREAIADARLIAVDAQLRATYQKTALERISDLLRTALKGGE